MITWNMGDNKNTASGWMENLRQMFEITSQEKCEEKPFNRGCFDVLAVALQEDYSSNDQNGKIGYMILDLLNEDIPRGNPRVWSMHTHENVGSPTEPFTVKLLLFTKTSHTTLKIEKEKVCLKGQEASILGKNVGICSKGTVGISLSHNKNKIIFLNSHLPMNRKSKSFGFNDRIKAMEISINNVLSKLDRNRDNLIVLWAGDMNFRQKMSIYDENDSQQVDEQLDYALNKYNSIKYKSIQFQEQDHKFPPTCKLKYCEKEKGCPSCRSNTDTFKDENCYVNDEEDKSKNREPSYCDRILYLVDGKMELKPMLYKSFSKGKAISYSDHNLVWADFVLSGFFD
ncbi:MAG: hypothetical protein JSR17_01610 [Proteobacteria bacterium]|nr:hypothetical protein [Pseudomonadota bacterium]